MKRTVVRKAKSKTHGRRKAKHWSLRLVRDDSSAPPLCVQVREGIRRQIIEGKLSADDALIPQRQLCKMLDINHVTLTQAISDLLKEGLLRSEHGRGIFVNKIEPPTVGVLYIRGERSLEGSGVYGPVYREASRVLAQANVRVKFITGELLDPDLRVGPAIKDVLNSGVDAYLPIGIQNDEYLTQLVQSGKPVVAADATPRHTNMNAIVCDSFREGYLATRYLIENGHRHIVFIGDDRGVHPGESAQKIACRS